MRLHNTLTRTTDEFVPQRGNKVTLYTCGPTVYNYYHIGNLRNATFGDTLRRALAAQGFEVAHVMNITDVGHLVLEDVDGGEDKLEKSARREGKTVREVSAHYTDAFKRDMAAMNVLPPNAFRSARYKDTYARATEFIDQQLDLVGLLVRNGYAYQTDEAIYFDVSKLAGYGRLSGQKLADKEVAARADVVTDPEKRHPYDFAVWFFTIGRFKDHSMRWPSPWGEGFPGWHLECSAIVHATLGDPIDIHTGGVDHIGTHHPNEMAQTEAAYGHDLSRFWVHNEFILVDGQKMAKSTGNTYTLADITARGHHPIALRLLYLMSHYRSEINFTWQSLEAAQTSLLNLQAWADLVHQSSPKLSTLPSGWHDELKAALADDLATPRALARLFEWTDTARPASADLAELDKLFGLSLAGRPDIATTERDLIKQREVARASKNYALADDLRRQLAKHHLAVEDTPAGPRWRRTQLT